MAIPVITDRNVQYPNRVELTEVSTDIYDVEASPGSVVAEGSAINKALLDQFAVETQTAASNAKTTPVDADTMPLVDSAASGVLKKVTWANIKTTLKTYFDAQYAIPGGTKAPFAEYAGSATTAGDGTWSITWPDARFTNAPLIVTTIYNAATSAFSITTAASTTGCSGKVLYYTGSTWSTTIGFVVHVYAVQRTSGSAAG